MTYMDRQTIDILNKDNPWIENPRGLQSWLHKHLPDPFVHRIKLSKSPSRWGDKNKAHLVVGPRQSGKSTVVWQWLSKQEQKVLFIDCEQPLIQRWCSSVPLFAADVQENFLSPPILFFEEVQHLDDAGLFFKGLVDRRPGVPVLVTGSSAYHLSSGSRESLAGRATRTRLLPFSWEEITAVLESVAPLARIRKQDELFERHIVYGGYPEAWLSERPEAILTDLLESFVLRDASDLHDIKRPDAFRTLLALAARQTGSLINVSEWAQISNLSRDSVYAYLEILQSAHILELIRPFAGGKRAEITRSPKVYWLDTGLRNRLLGNFQPFDQRMDRGALLENWVFTEITKHIPPLAEILFWRSLGGAEVDFVIRNGDRLVALEVKSTRSPRLRIPRSSRSFIDAYRPAVFGVVQPGAQPHGPDSRATIGATTVEMFRPIEVASWVERNAVVK